VLPEATEVKCPSSHFSFASMVVTQATDAEKSFACWECAFTWSRKVL